MNTQHFTRTFFAAGVIAAILLTGSNFIAQNVSESELRYQQAFRKQTVDGDLPAAIKIYQEIVASKADRALRARALWQLAICYETQGGKQAQAVYAQIVNTFGDQPAAAQAKKKLNDMRAPAPPSTMTLRKIEFGPGIQNVVATDSVRAVYWNAEHTQLFFSEVDGKNKKVILATTADRRPIVFPSRDLSMVFFYFTQSQQSPEGYAVVKTDGTGYRQLNLIENGTTLPVVRPQGVSWSRDNRYLLLGVRRQDRNGHLLKVSVADGQTVDLLPDRAVSVRFAISSPDERYIAFEDETGPIYVAPARGGEPQLIAPDAVMVDWTDDGKYLMFGADRDKTFSFFAVAMKEGRPAGAPIYIRAVERQSRPVSYGASIVYAQIPPQGAFQKVFVASLDAKDILSPWQEMKILGPGGFYPTWSPDGTRFAYIVHTINERASSVRIHTVTTGEDHELFPSSESLMNCVWASQHPVLYCGQPSTTGKTDVLQISTDTGRAENLRTFQGNRIMRQLSRDDHILYMGNIGLGTIWPQWEIGTDNETAGPNTVSVSPDAQWIMRNHTDSENRREYQIRLTSGTDADWRHLAFLKRQAALPGAPIPMRFTPDSNWLFYHDIDANGKDALFRVAPNGGDPQRLGDYPTSAIASQIEISLDGRHVLVNVPINPITNSLPGQAEFWVGQNFIPAAPASAAKPAAKAPAK
jgi:Tol biopolymer transport system component